MNGISSSTVIARTRRDVPATNGAWVTGVPAISPARGTSATSPTATVQGTTVPCAAPAVTGTSYRRLVPLGEVGV